MRGRTASRAVIIGAVAILVIAMASGTTHAGGLGKWTKISSGTVGGFDEVGMLRTSDGKLHVVWRKYNGSTYSIGWTTLSGAGKQLSSGNVLTGWDGIGETPRLVPTGSGGVRLIFKGQRDTSGDFYSRGSVYSATSANGSSWSLVNGTMAKHTVLNQNLGAAAEDDGTPVAAFGLNNTLWYHEGVDPSSPAAANDGEIIQAGFSMSQPALVTRGDGTVWMAWYRWTDAATQGYWVARVLPSEGTPEKAPGSGNPSMGNDPGQLVALAAGKGNSLFMAYCSPTATKPCAHIELWKVGASNAKVVPGSGTGNAGSVALSSGPGGRLWVAWFDAGQNKIHAVRTDTAGTHFGVSRTMKPPKNTFTFNGLQVEGSSGRADLIANVLLSTAGNPVAFWHTQVLPGLKLTASPSTFSHTASKRVTFTVTDAGQPVAGATVSCLGEHGKTNARGEVKLTFARGADTGRHVATAKKAGYNPGKDTIRVT